MAGLHKEAGGIDMGNLNRNLRMLKLARMNKKADPERDADLLLKKKIVSKCILLDSFSGFINPLKETFSDLRKYRFKNTE